MFLSGTLLNVAAVVVGTTVGLVFGRRMPPRLHETVTDGLGLFTLVLGVSLPLALLLEPATAVTDHLAVLGALVLGGALGEILRLADRLDAVGQWFQRRLARGERPSTISEAFVTASLVFCIGPLTILGSIENGLTGDIRLLAVKSLLDGVASVAFAAALGVGVYLSALTVLIVQGGIAFAAWALGGGVDARYVDVASAIGGFLLMGVGLRLLEIRRVRVVNFLPSLLLAPLFAWASEIFRLAV